MNNQEAILMILYEAHQKGDGPLLPAEISHKSGIEYHVAYSSLQSLVSKKKVVTINNVGKKTKYEYAGVGFPKTRIVKQKQPKVDIPKNTQIMIDKKLDMLRRQLSRLGGNDRDLMLGVISDYEKLSLRNKAA